MTNAIRVIPCLDVTAGRVVKGVHFTGLRDAGDPAELAARYEAAGADELAFLDITATTEGRASAVETVRRTAEHLFVPLTVGGGIRSVDDAAQLFDAGADRVSLNSAAVADPQVVAALASRFGSDAVVLAIDVRRADTATGFPSGYEVITHGGARGSGLDVGAWAARGAELGAGELLVTSVDTDGVKQGFDTELIAAVRAAADVPVVASGGAGEVAHFVEAARAGADAVLAASVFHFGEVSIGQVKAALAAAGFPVRPAGTPSQ